MVFRFFFLRSIVAGESRDGGEMFPSFFLRPIVARKRYGGGAGQLPSYFFDRLYIARGEIVGRAVPAQFSSIDCCCGRQGLGRGGGDIAALVCVDRLLMARRRSGRGVVPALLFSSSDCCWDIFF